MLRERVMSSQSENQQGPSELVPGEVRPSSPAVIRYCPYCGAPLRGDVYFCIVCATPFQNIEEVISPYRPRQLTDGERIERKAPRVWTLFWAYFSSIVVPAILAIAIYQENYMALYMILAAIAFAGTTCVFAVLHWRSLAVQFKRFGFFNRYAWLGLLGLVGLLLLNLFQIWVFEKLGAKGGSLETIREMGIGPVGMVLLICVFPAVLEEIGFRGLLQHWLQVAIRPWKAIVLASFLFAALHLSVLSLPYIFLVGMVLGWVKWKTQSLYPCILIHFLHNLIVLEFFG